MAKRGERQLLIVGLVSSLIVAAFGILTVIIGTIGRASVSTVAVGLFLGVIVSLSASVAVSRLDRVETVPVRIALAGVPGVGKTVYVNLLYTQLMRGESHVFTFTPEARTAQLVFRTLRRLREGEWPRSTTVDNVNRYLGTVAPTYPPRWTKQIIHGRREVKLEIGDAAGEYWREDRPDKDRLIPEPRDYKERLWQHWAGLDARAAPLLIESSFFEYVASSDALFYFIDLSQMIASDTVITEAVEDLLGALQVMGQLHRDSAGVRPLPIAVAFSKADLIEVERIFELAEAIAVGSSSFPYGPLERSLEDDASFSETSDDDFDRELMFQRHALRGFDESIFRRNVEEILRLSVVLDRLGHPHRFFILSSTGPNPKRPTPLGIRGPIDWSMASFLYSKHNVG